MTPTSDDLSLDINEGMDSFDSSDNEILVPDTTQANSSPQNRECHRRSSGKIDEDQRRKILQKFRECPGIKQSQLACWVFEELGISLSQGTISKILSPSRSQSGFLTADQKRQICEQQRRSKMTQRQLADWAQKQFNLTKKPTQPTISNILKRQREYITPIDRDSKRKRSVRHPRLDNVLANWILQCLHKRICLTGDLIKMKAGKFAEQLGIPNSETPSFSDGWLEKFQQRHNLRCYKSHGERGSADNEAINRSLPELRELVSGYRLSDVFNMDETGLFYRLCPDKTIAVRQLEGHKKDKVRLTIALTCNADGTEKLDPFIIGYAANPRCFKKKSAEDLGFYYRNNGKAWMTGVLFQEWMTKLDKRMRTSNRKILLLLDNAPSHIVTNMDLNNVRVHFLPANTTSKLQPLDAGIIAAFKRHYRRFQLLNALSRDESGERDIYKIDQLQAMRWVNAAWSEVSAETIDNCWKHSGIIDRNTSSSVHLNSDADVIDTQLADIIHNLRIAEPFSVQEYLFPQAESSAHEEFTDQDFLAISEDIDQLDDEDENFVHEIDEEKLLQCLPTVIAKLEENPVTNECALKVLRRLQLETRSSVAQMKQSMLVQQDIRRFF